MELFNCAYCKNGKGKFYSTSNKKDFKKHVGSKKHKDLVELNRTTGTNLCPYTNDNFRDEEFKRHMEINADYDRLAKQGLAKRLLPNYTSGNYTFFHELCPKGRRFIGYDQFLEWKDKRLEAIEEQKERYSQNNEQGVKKRLEYHLKKVKELRERLDRYAEKREKRELKELKKKKR